jgi:hypothetical protein
MKSDSLVEREKGTRIFFKDAVHTYDYERLKLWSSEGMAPTEEYRSPALGKDPV